MKLIKIIRSSVAANPDAGSTRFDVAGNAEITFHCKRQIPEKYINHVVIISEKIDGEYECDGILINPKYFDELSKIEGMSIRLDKNVLSMVSLTSQAKYLYQYELTYLKCNHCNEETRDDNIDEDYDDDGNRYMVCTYCQKVNSFEEFNYEDIEDVVSELGL